jgi:hypothetical protein
LRAEHISEGEMPASNMQVVSKVLSEHSSNQFLRSVGLKTPTSSKSGSSHESGFGSNLQLKRQQLFKVNLKTYGRKFMMLRKNGQGHRGS